MLRLQYLSEMVVGTRIREAQAREDEAFQTAIDRSGESR